MKPLSIIIILFLALPWHAHSQWYEWSDPFPLTDSLSDNKNPFLNHSWDNQEAIYMVWEKSVDSLSTEIWMANILDQETPQIVLSEPGIHYTHPKVLGSFGGYGDILFFLLYQTNESGNEDIYSIAYMLDGTWGEPEVIAASVRDEMQLSVSRELFTDVSSSIRGLLSWVANDDLYACFLKYDGSSYYFDDPVILDTAACSHPSVLGLDFDNAILYNRLDGSLPHLYRATYDSYSGWRPPEVYFDSLESMNPTATSYYGFPVWSVKTDSIWKIMTKVWNEFEVYDISSPEPFDPAALGVVIGVKSWYPEAYVAVGYPEDSVTEIFMTEYMGSGNFINFSNSGTMNRHPQFFMGETYPYNIYCWYDYLVWESFRNGHWQVWGAKFIQCMGGTEEEGEAAFIRVFPNPFAYDVTIEFNLTAEEAIRVDIFDRHGRYIITPGDKIFPPGTHQLRWNAEGHAPGIYILRMKAGDHTYTSKLIKK